MYFLYRKVEPYITNFFLVFIKIYSAFLGLIYKKGFCFIFQMMIFQGISSLKTVLIALQNQDDWPVH